MTTTWIRNADWVIAWDAAAKRHAYLQNACPPEVDGGADDHN